MSLSTAKDIFKHVWNRPVCELFSGKDTPGFSGECHVPESLKQCSWCEGKAARPEFVHEQIVAQMAQSISGLMQVSCLRLSNEPLLAKEWKNRTVTTYKCSCELTLLCLSQGGLEEILFAAGGEKGKGGSGWSWTHGDHGHKKSGGHSGVWAVFIIFVFVAAGAFIAALKIQRSQHNSSQYVDLNSMGYTPPIL